MNPRMIKQDHETRGLLARIDVALLDIEKEQARAEEIERLSRENAVALAGIRARLLVARGELRPILDTSAPRDVVE